MHAASRAPIAGEKPTGRVIEGVFDGEKMIGADGQSYPVSQNYASKSKIVVGDLMKLTITDDGRFVYKIIGPIEKKYLTGVLTQEDGFYRVLVEGKGYRVLTAPITFHKIQPGDHLSIIVPADHEASWAAVEGPLESSVDLPTAVTEAISASTEKPADPPKEAEEADDGDKPGGIYEVEESS